MIQLTKGLAMTADENCFIVGKARTRADKGIVLDHPRYYTTAVQAVCAALNSAMRQGVADGMSISFSLCCNRRLNFILQEPFCEHPLTRSY